MSASRLETPERYAAAISAAETPEALRDALQRFEELAGDAIQQAKSIQTPEQWRAFRKGLASERRGKFAGEKWAEAYGAILMPGPMLKVAMIANEYKVPFFVALLRVREIRPELLKP